MRQKAAVKGARDRQRETARRCLEGRAGRPLPEQLALTQIARRILQEVAEAERWGRAE
jgi:hypothetical protein